MANLGTVGSMAHDPLRGFKFRVEIQPNGPGAGFSKVSGLREETEVVEYREGTDPVTVRKLPGLTSYGDVTLERGLSTDRSIISWREEIIRLSGTAGAGANTPDGLLGADFRRNVKIRLYNKEGENIFTWTLRNAWPRSLEYTDLDAQASNVVVTRLVLAHEGLVPEPNTSLMGVVTDVAAARRILGL